MTVIPERLSAAVAGRYDVERHLGAEFVRIHCT